MAFHRGEGRQSTPLVEEGLFTASEAETTGSDSGATRTCVEHSNAAGHPCVRFVKSIFDEIISGIHHGISTAGHWGSALYHKAVRVVNWPREKGCEYYAHIKCNIGNTASSCELETFTLYASSFIPGDRRAERAAGWRWHHQPSQVLVMVEMDESTLNVVDESTLKVCCYRGAVRGRVDALSSSGVSGRSPFAEAPCELFVCARDRDRYTDGREAPSGNAAHLEVVRFEAAVVCAGRCLDRGSSFDSGSRCVGLGRGVTVFRRCRRRRARFVGVLARSAGIRRLRGLASGSPRARERRAGE